MSAGPRKADTKVDQVAELLAAGLSSAQIGARLGISRNSVQSYILRIRRELGPQAI